MRYLNHLYMLKCACTYDVSEGTVVISGRARMRCTSSSGACAWYESISSATLYFCSDRRIFSYNCNQAKNVRAKIGRTGTEIDAAKVRARGMRVVVNAGYVGLRMSRHEIPWRDAERGRNTRRTSGRLPRRISRRRHRLCSPFAPLR